MCAEAGLEGHFTNHSGKRTCATTLFQAGTDEQLVMHRTGHRSSAGVRAYKRHSSAQDAHLSKLLDPPSPKPKTVKQEPVTSTVTSMKPLKEESDADSKCDPVPQAVALLPSVPSVPSSDTDSDTFSLLPSPLRHGRPVFSNCTFNICFNK